MTEINKLKIENARYKKALENILDGDSPRTLAEVALNLPPPPPVTLDSLLSALKKFNITRPLSHIDFFADESGRIVSGEKWIFSFESLQEAYDFLTHEN